MQRETNRILSQFTGLSSEVDELYMNRLAQLQAAPKPEHRAIAALGLSRAVGYSGDVVPALIHAIKTDVALEVRLAAATSIAGFSDASKLATPILIDRIEKEDQEQKYIYLTALAEIDSDSPQLRKIVVKMLDSRRTDDFGTRSLNLHPVCFALAMTREDNKWAIPHLIDTAELALKRGDRSELENLALALSNVGPRDTRVISFFDKAAEDGPSEYRVFFDSVARQLKLELRQ
jgi:hypothetical protein